MIGDYDQRKGLDINMPRKGGPDELQLLLDRCRRTGNVPVDALRGTDPELYHELEASTDLEDARARALNLVLRRLAYYYSSECRTEDLERVNALNCLQVMRNFLSPRNEEVAKCSTLGSLLDLVRAGGDVPRNRSHFFLEMLYLAKGTMGRSDIYLEEGPRFLEHEGREAATIRSDYLDGMARRCLQRAMSYPAGLDPSVARRREKNRDHVLEVLGGSRADWEDHQWHLDHVLVDADLIGEIIELNPEEERAIRLACKKKVPFGITPYYISLMDRRIGEGRDHAVRAQVIPKLESLLAIIPARESQDKTALDFMKEHQTSPVDLVTRRYPMIAIFKPYNSCAQICAYCQRNWEIDTVLEPRALASRERIEAGLRWFEQHPMVSEVLITGGDPAVMPDQVMRDILQRFAAMRHVRRIRVGSRVPVVLPMRITDPYASILAEFLRPPDRDICLVSHYEHPYEVTGDSMRAVRRLRDRGLMVYNQQVFTFENCRRFETVALRLALKQIGVDPYYTFNTKGKEETAHFRVPIARILQERKEEARLIPGIARTDEPVFNIPGLGKNHLRAWQHHDLIMLSPEGERVYEFHPWEKNISLAPTYIYRDVPLVQFMNRLAERGEDMAEYRSIWYYF